MADLTIIDLGQKVKAKYPGQYDDLSDADVGRKVKAKFPGQYDDFKDTPSTLAERQAASKATAEANAPQYPWYSRYLSNETLGKAQQAVDAILHTSDSPSVKADSMLAAITPGGPETEGMGLMEGLKASPAAQAVRQAAGAASEAAGKVGDTASSAWDRIKGLVPSKTGAAAKLEAIKEAAKDVPVDVTEAARIADEAKGITATGGGAPPTPMAKFIQRMKPSTSVVNGQPVVLERDPINYPESFQFASNAGRLSAGEALNTTPVMDRQLAMFTKALKTANRSAADSVGMGNLYDEAMREYRRAMTIEEAKEFLKKNAWKFGVGALVGGGITGAALKEFGP